MRPGSLAMESAKFFGSNPDTWVFLFMGVLAAVAVVVIARQKRRRWAELGDDEEALPHDATIRDHSHDSDQPPPPRLSP